MSQLRLVLVSLGSLALLMSACASGDSGSSTAEGVPIDTNGDGVTDGYDTNGDGVIDSSSISSTQTRTRSNFQSNNTNNSSNNNTTTNNSGSSSSGTSTTTTIVHHFEVNRPLPFTAADFTALQSEAGFINPHSSPVFVVGAVQLYRVKGCKTANVEVKWSSGESWITYFHMFFESSASPGSWGEGSRQSVSLLLPPSGAVRVREDTNPDCAPGSMNAASVRNEGVLFVGAPNSFDWNRSIIE